MLDMKAWVTVNLVKGQSQLSQCTKFPLCMGSGEVPDDKGILYRIQKSPRFMAVK